VAQGHRVWTITRGQRPLPEGVTALTADRRDEASFERAVRGAEAHWDLVVDCIGFDPADARQDIALFRTLARHLVFVSTDFVYDPAYRAFPQGEEAARYLAEGYGGKKRQCELELSDGDTGDMAWTVVRPCHIYGPGSQLGCLPEHSRDAQLIDRLKDGEPLRLVGGGHFLQQPIFVRDLAELLLSVGGIPSTYGQVYNAAGPDVIESRTYYQIIADVLGVDLQVKEVPVSAYRAANPGRASFLCHRIYDLTRLHAAGAGVEVPATSIEQGLREHVESLLSQ
jgi:nucleoside-diphosphate-sugar epimerase